MLTIPELLSVAAIRGYKDKVAPCKLRPIRLCGMNHYTGHLHGSPGLRSLSDANEAIPPAIDDLIKECFVTHNLRPAVIAHRFHPCDLR